MRKTAAVPPNVRLLHFFSTTHVTLVQAAVGLPVALRTTRNLCAHQRLHVDYTLVAREHRVRTANAGKAC